MRYHDLLPLTEKRRNPEHNPRLSDVEFLRQYKDRPDTYLHTTSIAKVGIYPRTSNSHDSPAGIYAYRLADIWEDDIERWNTGDYRRGLEFLAYYGGPHLFVLQSDIDPDFPGHYTEANLDADSVKLQASYQLSDQEVVRLRRAARTNQNFRDCPAGYLWGMTKALVAGVSEFDEHTPTNTRRWNAVLRKLGYVGFNDPGYGLIHGAESSQAVFLTSAAYTVIDHMQHRQRQPSVKIGDIEYKGGRLPRHLVMDGIPNTFFHNHDPEAFRKVQTWTVKYLSLREFAGFRHFLPWNATGIIENLGLGESSITSSFRPDYYLDSFLKTPLPANIHIRNATMGGRDPGLLLRKVPADFPAETITVSRWASDYGLDKLPEPLRSKIRRE